MSLTEDDLRFLSNLCFDLHMPPPYAQRYEALIQEITAGFAASARGQHCATCQCGRIGSPAFVADNKFSRSWHGNAPNSSEEANKR